MIIGAHAMLYSQNADADRAFLRDVLALSHVDVGHGWLIFHLPPTEVAVHPADGPPSHQLYLMCDDIDAFRADLIGRGVPVSEAQPRSWGQFVDVTLPSGASLGVYQPRHARPGV